MTIPIYQVDAFTHEYFSGNPAAVCLLRSQNYSESWMQSVAAEMNLAETAFVTATDNGFLLRWFTPKVEVDLCGHATLASAHVLWNEEGYQAEQPIIFHSKSGVLQVNKRGNEIEMDFPAIDTWPIDIPVGLSDALGIASIDVFASKHDYLVVLASEDSVRSLKPDSAKLKMLPMHGVIVTASADSRQYDFVSRYFAPALGVDEDPATGSAHCALMPYWSSRKNKSELVAHQVSSRGGVLNLKLLPEKSGQHRVLICGEAKTVLKGELYAIE